MMFVRAKNVPFYRIKHDHLVRCSSQMMLTKIDSPHSHFFRQFADVHVLVKPRFKVDFGDHIQRYIQSTLYRGTI